MLHKLLGRKSNVMVMLPKRYTSGSFLAKLSLTSFLLGVILLLVSRYNVLAISLKTNRTGIEPAATGLRVQRSTN